jgi:3-oxoacyl-[acyl-carrier protein] reductase
MIDLIPLRRPGAPSEVADVICYLAGARSSYLTGINIEIAGGAL